VTEVIAWRKAPPGGSNHSNGNAVDLARTVKGERQPNEFNNQHDWKASWEYWWLVANAARFGFKNYPKEAWHWEWYA
jgi:LAS superfamily LD-carboxypeptidase LdcB